MKVLDNVANYIQSTFKTDENGYCYLSFILPQSFTVNLLFSLKNLSFWMMNCDQILD